MTEVKRKNRADKRRYHFVYKTTCTVTGKWYLGMHSTDDLNDGYLGSGTILSRSVKKYGRDAHVMEILFMFETRQEAADKERELITEELRASDVCMNIQRGGQGSHLRPDATEETKQKLSDASKKWWNLLRDDPVAYALQISKMITPESVAKRAEANRGKTRGDTSKMQAAQQALAAGISDEEWRRRALLSHETRRANGSGKGGRPKGTPMSDEQKARQSAARKADPNSVLKIKVSCIHCRKVTSLTGLTSFHKHPEAK